MNNAIFKTFEQYLAEGKAIVLINIPMVLLIAWVTSLWLNLGVSSLFGDIPEYKPKKASGRSGRVERVDYSIIAKRSMFNPGGAVSTPGPAAKDTEIATAAPTTLNLELLGTIITGIPEENFAVISKKGGKTQKLYGVTDTVGPNATIIRINRFAVYIDVNGNIETLSLDMEKGFPSTAKPSLTSKRKTARPSIGDKVREINPGQMVMDRNFLQNQMKDMSSLLTQVRAVPNKNKDGSIDGFKLFQIQKGSIFEKIGLKNMDVLKRVNGQNLNSAEKGLELFSAFKSEARFELDIVRNNDEKTIIVEIQ
jgi:general secretion pathway protein C